MRKGGRTVGLLDIVRRCINGHTEQVVIGRLEWSRVRANLTGLPRRISRCLTGIVCDCRSALRGARDLRRVERVREDCLTLEAPHFQDSSSSWRRCRHWEFKLYLTL